MKKIATATCIVVMLGFSLFTNNVQAQTAPPAEELKEDKVWTVEYIRTKPGKSEAYEKYLAKNYMKIMTKAKEKGIIADFMLLSSMPANDQDWDIMILIAVNKFADLDGMSEKFDALIAEVFDPKDEARQKELEDRYALRVFQGGKMARNLVLK